MSIPGQVRGIGLVWYREADYDRLKAMFIDGDKLPRSFLQWQDQAEQLRKRCVREGALVVKAYVDPDTFPAWCQAHGANLDSSGRNAFANAEAYRVLVAAQQNGHGSA